MPGAYAHITLVNQLREPSRLEALPDFPNQLIIAVLRHFKYCELGSVSPDYPYLAVTDRGAATWADAMHYESTVDMIHVGIKHIKNISNDLIREKCTAWLLGYAAHVAADVTIHPIVQLKVGPYAENKKEHRVCEMNQDAHIFQRLNLGEIGLSEHLDSGICACVDEDGELDQDIKSLWVNMLHEVYPNKVKENTPIIENWNSGFRRVVENIAEEGNRLLPLARHVAVNLGLTYPALDSIDQQYIADLQTPSGIEHYDTIFDRAVDNIASVWSEIANRLLGNMGNTQQLVGNWNLDTGENENGELVFWS